MSRRPRFHGFRRQTTNPGPQKRTGPGTLVPHLKHSVKASSSTENLGHQLSSDLLLEAIRWGTGAVLVK